MPSPPTPKLEAGATKPGNREGLRQGPLTRKQEAQKCSLVSQPLGCDPEWAPHPDHNPDHSYTALRAEAWLGGSQETFPLEFLGPDTRTDEAQETQGLVS